MIPNEQSYCEIDPSVVDRWGIPVLRFHCKWTDYELQPGAPHAARPSARSSTQMGGTPLTPMPATRDGLRHRAGRTHHPRGRASRAWATRPRTSVLNADCQAHDVKNLFVADGGPFVTNADKNATWTILALAMRTSDYIAEQRKAGTI